MKEHKEGINRFKYLMGMDVHRKEIKSCAYDYIKDMLVTLSDDQTIRFYKNVCHLKLVGRIKHNEKVEGILIDPSGE